MPFAGVVLAVAPLGCQCSEVSAPAPGATLRARFSYEVAAEVVNPTSCPATGLRLRDRSSGEPTSWRWTFEDGTTSTEQHPTLDRPVPLGSEVTLTVHRGDESDTTTEVITYAEC